MTQERRCLPLPADATLRALVEHLVPDGTPLRHSFTPHGLSLARLGPRGSVVVHTWPEHRLATVDAWGAAAGRLDAALDTFVTPLQEAPCPICTST